MADVDSDTVAIKKEDTNNIDQDISVTNVNRVFNDNAKIDDQSSEKQIDSNELISENISKQEDSQKTDTNSLAIDDSDKKLIFSNLTDHVPPISPVKAVLSTTETENMLSDDETPKVLTTLETVKKSKPIAPICEVEADTKQTDKLVENLKESELLIEPSTVESNLSEQDEEMDFEDSMPADISEIAKKQLESLNNRKQRKGRKSENSNHEVISIEKVIKLPTIISTVDNGKDLKEIPVKLINKVKDNLEIEQNKRRLFTKTTLLTSSLLTSKELEREIEDRIKQKINEDKKPKAINSTELIKNLSNRLGQKVNLSKITRQNESDSKSGSIEIPHELILSNEITSPVISTTNTTRTHLGDQDLLAILEGNDEGNDHLQDLKSKDVSGASELSNKSYNAASIKIVATQDKSKLFDKKTTTVKVLDKDLERELALKQIMNLPKKRKGRKPKVKTIDDYIQTSTPKIKKEEGQITGATSDLVNSLVMDWSDNEKGDEDGSDNIDKGNNNDVTSENILVKTGTKRKQPMSTVKSEILNINANQESVPYKRTRIIKKKIIWDPDAPETQVSYASLVQNVSSKKSPIVKKTIITKKTTPDQINKIKKEPLVEQENNKILNKYASNASSNESSPNNSIKKKKSEIDKLLGDEGAANMIYSLEHQTNNNDEETEMKTRPNKNTILTLNNKDKKIIVAKTQIIKNTDATTQSGRVVRMIKKENSTTSPISVQTQQNQKKDTINNKRKVTRSSTNSPPPPTGTASESWDYVFLSQRADDSMIIRRRSNSSYSSTASLRRLSSDNQPSSPPVESSNKKQFQFAKPNDKKLKDAEPISTDINKMVANLKGKLNKVMNQKDKNVKDKKLVQGNDVNIKIFNDNDLQIKQEPQKLRTSERKLAGSEYKEITIRRYDNFVQIILTPCAIKLKNVLTIQLMNEVKQALQILQQDAQCKAVLVTSSGNSFCQGIDFSILMQNTVEKRKSSAVELATCVRNFLKALATFTKPLIAGVHGSISGIGVTMLPLFDLVLANDKATFFTPYAKIGQLPEGNCVLLLSRRLSHTVLTELLFLCRIITSSTALEHGLVTKVLWPDKFQEEILQHTKTIANHSLQSLEIIKLKMTQENLKNLDQQLLDEQKILIQHWLSTECQEKFKHYLSQEEW